MSRIQFVRQMLPRIRKDYYELWIYHNPNGTDTFDPGLTTSVSTTVIWQTEAGVTVTTGTTHNLSYTPTAGPKVCKVTVLAGLRAVVGMDAGNDAITNVKNLRRTSITTFTGESNPFHIPISDISMANTIYCWPPTRTTGLYGDIANYSRLATYIQGQVNDLISGSISSLPTTIQTAMFYSCSLIMPASIAHLVALRDLRIYSMGWTAQQNTDVLLSAWNARANYTYASGIQIRISAPTGTPGTEPPAAGESNADWSWNAETNRHDPLTGYAASSDLQNDFYSEGFKGWTVTIV